MFTPQHNLVQKYLGAFMEFYCYVVSALRDEPVLGALQQCQPCARAADLVIGLWEIMTLAKCNFTPEHLLDL